ncbi:Microsomal glutathione S-transferase 3 [Paramyrothecium foliicola]|nr:Microsomal glutathione S-transferase 3 [Paramyrothecium foliicola]
MPFSLVVPDEYGYVLGVAASTALVNLYLSSNVMKHRKASGIKYPNMYASSEQAAKDPAVFKYNCAQRAHGNFLEAQASFLTGLLISGLRWPIPVATLGAGWIVSRILYAVGYTNNGPGGRVIASALSSLSSLALAVMAISSSVMYVRGN